MKKIITVCFMIMAFLVGGIHVEASNVGKPLTQYAIVESGSGMAKLRSKSDMGRILKSLGFKIVSNKSTFKAVRNGTTVVMTKIRNGNKCVITFGTQSETNEFIDSMIKSKWIRSGNSNTYTHPEFMFGGGVEATVKGNTITIVYEWDGTV